MPQTVFGPEENPITVFSRAMEGGFDASALRASREKRLREMERNIDLEAKSRQDVADWQRAQAFKSPSDRRRDEMMGWGHAPSVLSIGATPSDVRNLQADLNEDPDTGVLAQQRTGRINRTLEDAATTQRNEVSDAVDLGTRRNAFGKYLDTLGAKRGQYAADVSPEGSQALNDASRRKQAELGITAAGRMGHGGIPIAALKPGDDPLDGLSEQEKATIKGLLDYTIQLPGGAALRTPEWMDRLGRAKLLDPSFDQTQYKQRQDMRTDKKFQENIQSLGTLREHADSLFEKGKQLNNYGGVLSPMNSVKNWWKKLTSDPTLAGYGLDQTTVGDEYARALKGGVPTQGESEHARSLLDANQSPEAQQEVHRTINELAGKRLDEAGQVYDAKMGKVGAFQAYLEKTRGKANQIAAGDTGGQTPPPNPRKGERFVFSNGKVGIWDGSGWEAQ